VEVCSGSTPFCHGKRYRDRGNKLCNDQIQVHHLGFLFLVDAAVLFHLALLMEKSVQALRRQESSNGNNNMPLKRPYSLTHVHAKVSKMLDSFLSQGRSKLPEVSFFVNILYLAAGICFVATAVSLALFGFFHIPQSVCNPFHETPTLVDLTIDGVPDALQKWASHGDSEQMLHKSVSYVHMVNGYTYFVTSNQTQGILNPNEEVLFSAGPDGSLKSYPQITVPGKQFRNIAGTNADESEGFCCLYVRNKIPIEEDWKWFLKEVKLLCITVGDDDNSSPTLSSVQVRSDSSEELLPKEMKTLRFPIQEYDNGGMDSGLEKSLRGTDLQAYDGLLYLRMKWYIRDTRGGPRGDAEQVDIYSVKPQTSPLNWTSVGHRKVTHVGHRSEWSYFVQHQSSLCFQSIKFVATLVGVPLLFLTAYGLLFWRDIPAGMASFCIGVLAILSVISDEFDVGVGALASVVGVTILLLLVGTTTRKILRPWISRDMVLWGIYSTMAVLALISPGFWCCWKWPVGRLCLAVLTGFVLDHPVLHIMGWMSAAMTLLVLFLAIWGSMMTTTTTLGRTNDSTTMWHAAPLGLVITCGLFSLSFSLQKSKPYLVAYLRPSWRILQLASRNAFSSSRGGQGTPSNNNNNNNDTALMQSLLSTRDE
jgi:hypothetical protein